MNLTQLVCPPCFRYPQTETSLVSLLSPQPGYRVLPGLQQDRRHRAALPGRGGGLLVPALHPGGAAAGDILQEADGGGPGGPGQSQNICLKQTMESCKLPPFPFQSVLKELLCEKLPKLAIHFGKIS